MYTNEITTSNTRVLLKAIEASTCSLYIKREDEIHRFVSGNKYRKLKYNLQQALTQKKRTLITFGGAFSNHIAAVAVAGNDVGLNTVGVIRGDELVGNYAKNTTLQFAEQCGMQFEFVSREAYRMKETSAFQQPLLERYPNSIIIPEGGTNELAVQGCEEILNTNDFNFDFICAATGTGGTLAGLIRASKEHQKVIGYSALKGTFQKDEIQKYTEKLNFTLKDTYSFGGYAKIDSYLVRFMNDFKEQTGILLDPVYTAKMLYGIVADIKNGFFPENSRILAIHTGGLQGIYGMNQRLKSKNAPQIKT